MSFMNMAWTWALGLVVVPLIIHYLLRKQNIVSWGAMEILMRVYKRRKRRRRIEELLLLLLRMAIMLLLALALMLPEFKSDTKVLNLSQDPIVVVLDTSLSTSRKDGLKTVLDRLKENAISFINEQNSGREIFLITTPDEEIVSRVGRGAVIDHIGTLQPQWRDGHMAHVVTRLQEELRQRNQLGCQVEIFSDFQKSDFDSVEKWPSQWEVNFHPLILAQKDNYLLKDFKAGKGLPALNRPWIAEVTVVGPPGTVNITASESGAELFKKDIRVPDNGEVTVPLAFTFFDEGWKRLELSLEEDVYEFDNKQYMALQVSAQNRVLILSSFKSEDYRKDETTFFEMALSPREGEMDIQSLTAPPENLANYDVYVLANVDHLADEVVESITEEVNKGSLLVVCCGSRSDDEFYAKAFPFLPKLQERVRDSRRFLPDSGGDYRLWSSYFKPYTFENYITLSDVGQAQWRDEEQRVVVASGRMNDEHSRGSWLMTGFGLNFGYGDWVGSPLYLSFARSLINNFPHPRHVGPNQICSDGLLSSQQTPGFFDEEGLVVSVNPPLNESDVEVLDGDIWEDSGQTEVVSNEPQPLALLFIAAFLLFLFGETIWNARQA